MIILNAEYFCYRYVIVIHNIYYYDDETERGLLSFSHFKPQTL